MSGSKGAKLLFFYCIITPFSGIKRYEAQKGQ